MELRRDREKRKARYKGGLVVSLKQDECLTISDARGLLLRVDVRELRSGLVRLGFLGDKEIRVSRVKNDDESIGNT